MPVPWSTGTTMADADRIYSLYQHETDPTRKSLFDGALANAQGLYRDGIANYNSSSLPVFTQAPEKLKLMTQKYPLSDYAENASFYIGQYYIKAYFLNVSPASSQISSSNAAFESYIAHIQAKDFPTRNFYAAGYYFRSLNGWVVGNLADATSWLDKGLQPPPGPNFSDNDVVYVYQLLYGTTVIDRFLPAKTLFLNTRTFINATPPPPYTQANSLAATIKGN
jgi:hypothetical protein